MLAYFLQMMLYNYDTIIDVLFFDEEPFDKISRSSNISTTLYRHFQALSCQEVNCRSSHYPIRSR